MSAYESTDMSEYREAVSVGVQNLEVQIRELNYERDQVMRSLAELDTEISNIEAMMQEQKAEFYSLGGNDLDLLY